MTNGLKVDFDVIQIKTQSGYVSLAEYPYAIGFEIEVTDQSLDTIMKVGYKDRYKIQINQGDASRQFGGQMVCGIPCYLNGTIYWDFTTNLGPDGLIIVALLSGETQAVPGI